jgi:hypothetical protein
MIHHSYRDLLNKDSLKIFNVIKQNVQGILWEPAPHEREAGGLLVPEGSWWTISP